MHYNGVAELSDILLHHVNFSPAAVIVDGILYAHADTGA